MTHPSARADETRKTWKAVLETYHEDRSTPVTPEYWSDKDTWSRDRIEAVQNEKIAAVAPFLYENSAFYRRRFDKLGVAPTDLKDGDSLIANWPIVTKQEMMEDATEHPPYGTYTTCSDEDWADRGWMLFSSSGSTGVPRVFRYTHFDRQYWEQANARALYSGGLRQGDSAIPMVGFGPHVFAWGVQYTLAKMGLPVVPGGGVDGHARASFIDRFKPTVLVCTPSYALYLGRVMQDMGMDPAATSIKWMVTGGEPFSGVSGTLERLQDLWAAKAVEFYGCTEASPHCGGYSCPEYQEGDEPFIHFMEDIQLWETVDADTLSPVADGERGLTVCTNLNSESSAQLRFLVGDYTRLSREPCACGRNHVRGLGCMTGRSDDLINLRGIKFFPVQIEEAVRAVPGTGDEFQIRLTTQDDGLDVMRVLVEHESDVADRVAKEIRSRCEIRCAVEVVTPNTLPKSEMKAKRVFDERNK
ncbi:MULTISPECIES: AMP-binding protein [Maritimibacter]|uniref:Phenylacetate-CoA ligase n=1 Tax=Maritimibacter alkaliphilus HTCC2654 TaxID=314271 RepID=A3VG56_9RHOB|nr:MULTISPECIES: AMP-binding protein [Maritimibacter]EAQ12832.1 phenylacetate-CoA ligase [Rhodobacterales bacterium HTCC2654] [Maritimibacter alkaliphilus HTCC2654]MBL6429016.1 AMP-binding protein [Maritimibacter sp.]TYP85775.1 phenylacetate-CoA ligase [Maritimibacter alkaliphilus HTCC2654]